MRLLAGSLVAFVLFALLLRRVARSPDGGLAFDHAVRRVVEPAFHPVGRRVAQTVSIPGFPGVYMPAAALLALWLWRARHLDAARAAVVPGTALLAWALHRLVKRAYRRVRPPTCVARGKTEPAFPSGHTTGTTALAASGAWALAAAGVATAGGAATGAALLVLLVGLSRVYLDEHWTTDVLGGLTLGVGVALGLAALSLRPPS